MKNLLERFNNKFQQAEKQSVWEQKKKKIIKKNEQHLRDFWDTVKCISIHIKAFSDKKETIFFKLWLKTS